MTAGGATSWYGYAKHVLGFARVSGHSIKVANDAIVPIASAAFASPTCRSLNSRLDTRKLKHQFGLHLPGWLGGVERMLSELLG